VRLIKRTSTLYTDIVYIRPGYKLIYQNQNDFNIKIYDYIKLKYSEITDSIIKIKSSFLKNNILRVVFVIITSSGFSCMEYLFFFIIYNFFLSISNTAT